MTLSRLLLPRLRSRINILECRRWCSSVNNKGGISQSLKKSEVEQQNAMAVEIFEKKHITEDEGVFPRETHVQKEVGAWNNLVGILQRTKKKFLGNHMEQKSSSTHALASTSDLKDSDNVVSADSHDSGSKNNLKITIHSEKTSVADKEENVDSETSQSSYADMSEPLEVVNMKNTSNSAAPEELLNVSSKECEEIAGQRVNGMSSGASSICGKANCNDGVQLGNICHRPELVEKEREPLLVEEASSSVQISSSGEILSKYEEDIMESCKFSSKLKLERSDTSDSSCGPERVANLLDVSQEKRNNESELEGKNDQMQKEEVISEIVSILKKKGTSNLEQVAYSNSFLPSEATNKWRDVLVKKSVFSASEHRPSEDISSPILISKSKMEEISSVSSNSFQIMSLGDHDMETDHGAGDQIVYPKSEQSVSREFEHLNETSQNTFGKSGVIKSLIECISDLPPREPSVVRTEENVVDRSVDSSRERTANSSIEAETDKQTFDRKESKTSSPGVVGKKEKSRRSNTVLEYLNSGVDFCKSIETKGENASFSENLSDENKVTVKFVNLKATESDVSNALKKFGAIKKVVFPSVKSTKFKVAHVYFESEEGRQKALETSDVSMAKVVLVLEATSPPKGKERMRIPDLIGCPDVPTSLVKHPPRTAMIKNLKHNVSFHDIEKALAFCRSNITGIFFGSSSSIAYVEFETVEDKEIAVEKASLIVLGERLPILRIDTPRTTTIRISNIHFPLSKLVSVCRSFGNVREVLQRASNIVDVRFDFAEWPRMLKILNRLNGVEVDGCQLVAKPAPVYSPNVLNVLWSQPEGRRHLKTTFNDMLLKFGGKGVGAVAMTEVVDNFYTDAQER
ncbi:probable GPI-anchored adhesin-like protein PGA55 isoform X1 [Nicotiana sylvestris]|uniref:Uncharacterized protein LOC104218709 isoform X1 n=2 Tax=Nicotiana sylvestris TaxID=4096 RepID=A0A1U7VZZ0_NICSY|nr:PREDICTED: uncharacterized protein LOC104218709 isoform X1 [Nicotiana sylvestris]